MKTKKWVVTLGLAGFALASDAFAASLNPQPLDVTGMNPKLAASTDKQRIYLTTASPSGKVRKFNTTTLAWESGIPDIPGMSDIDLGYAPWTCAIGQCWGGPAFAVGKNDVLHVVWGDLGRCACNPYAPFNTSVHLKHTRYNGSGWSTPETIVKRLSEDDPECGYQSPNLAEDEAGNMLVSYTHAKYIDCPNPPDCNVQEGTHYHTYSAAEGWKYRERIGGFKATTHAAGRFGRLLMGYSLTNRPRVAEIDPATGQVSSDEVIGTETTAPYLFLAGADDLHAFYGGNSSGGAVYTNAIYYNRKTGGGWQHPGSLLISDNPAIFVPPTPPAEYTAVIDLAVTPSGKRLMAFSYAKKLYFVFYDGVAWGDPVLVETGGEAWSVAVSAVGDGNYLVVWSAALSPDAEVFWALVPADGADTPDGGHDAGGPDAGSCTQCPDGCYDLDSDHDHCGRCDKKCLVDEVCYQAICSYPSEIDASIPDAALTDGGAADAGQPGDTGAVEDSGTETDGGGVADTGLTADTGAPADAGGKPPSDAGKTASDTGKDRGLPSVAAEGGEGGCGCATLNAK
ncbi:MAG: hypothetical protein HY897_12290 [Deltaproteobacteria bacterium]|nr:hypothetical protein [Deltaproteobacteria bacterium]